MGQFSKVAGGILQKVILLLAWPLLIDRQAGVVIGPAGSAAAELDPLSANLVKPRAGPPVEGEKKPAVSPAAKIPAAGAVGGSKGVGKAGDRSAKNFEAPADIMSRGGRLLAQGSSPSWSPKGKSIVFCHREELDILDIESGRTRRFAAPGRSPAWSPGDGRYIAFVRGPKEAEEVWVCASSLQASPRQGKEGDWAGGTPHRLALGKDPRWSADGGTIYFVTKNQQYRAISPDGRGAARAVPAPGKPLNGKGIATEDGTGVYRQNGNSLQIIDRKTGKIAREWPALERVNEPPVCSPHGHLLAYAGFCSSGGSILGVLDVEKNRLRCVGDGHFGCPRWSPDGSQLAVVMRRAGPAFAGSRSRDGQAGGEIWCIAASALERLQRFAPACECPTVPQAAASLVGPLHRPRGSLVPIDLSRQANWFYKDTVSELADNNLAEFPPGDRTLAGVLVRTGSRVIQLQGKHMPNMPSSVGGIPVHLRVVRLYFVHAAHQSSSSQGVSDGELIAEYRLLYADGDLAIIPVIVGQDVRDWWTKDQKPISRGQVAWAGNNKAATKMHSHVRLYLSTWKNPQPEKTVRAIDYVSMGTGAAPFCVAITVEQPQSVASSDQALADEANRRSQTR